MWFCQSLRKSVGHKCQYFVSSFLLEDMQTNGCGEGRCFTAKWPTSVFLLGDTECCFPLGLTCDGTVKSETVSLVSNRTATGQHNIHPWSFCGWRYKANEQLVAVGGKIIGTPAGRKSSRQLLSAADPTRRVMSKIPLSVVAGKAFVWKVDREPKESGSNSIAWANRGH